jgi:hypothetical protein
MNRSTINSIFNNFIILILIVGGFYMAINNISGWGWPFFIAILIKSIDQD